MDTSNLIALGALIVAVVSLIPQFHQMNKRKPNSLKSENSKSINITNSKDKVEKEMPFMQKILLLIVFAVATFLIEIILFRMAAYFFDVETELNSMPLLWKVIFYSLFLIPSTFIFFAFLVFLSQTED